MVDFKMGTERYNRPLDKVVAIIPKCYMDWNGPGWSTQTHDHSIDQYILPEIVDWLQQYECIVYSLIYDQHRDLLSRDAFFAIGFNNESDAAVFRLTFPIIFK